MDYKYIEQLLNRYFEGDTSLQEEQILKAFFAQGTDDMPQELSQYVPLFEMLGEKETLGEDFDRRMMAMTEDAERVKARTISLAERFRPLFRVAAMVAIVLTLSNAINQSFRQDEVWVDADNYASVGVQVVTTDSPAMAYEQNTDSLAFGKEGLPLPADSLKEGLLN